MSMRDEDLVSRLRREMHPGPTMQAWLHLRNQIVASEVARLVRRIRQRLGAWVGQISLLCPHCNRAVERETVGQGERVFWCPHCATVRDVPLFRIPGWVAGTIVVLAIKLHFAL